MRILVISDIHANLEALESVLEDAGGNWDVIWCLGDVIGYGPDPNECVARLREHEHLSLSGNHDWAILGKLDLSEFNHEARLAVSWAQDTCTPETLAYLDTLPPRHEEEQVTLAHGSPRHPVWEYLVDVYAAQENFQHFTTPYCLVGHSHVPLMFVETEPDLPLLLSPEYGSPLALKAARMIINPGSVGQPRDSDPRAAYGLLDLDKMLWEFHRVPYPVKNTQEKMRQAGLPHPLIQRLEYGW